MSKSKRDRFDKKVSLPIVRLFRSHWVLSFIIFVLLLIWFLLRLFSDKCFVWMRHLDRVVYLRGKVVSAGELIHVWTFFLLCNCTDGICYTILGCSCLIRFHWFVPYKSRFQMWLECHWIITHTFGRWLIQVIKLSIIWASVHTLLLYHLIISLILFLLCSNLVWRNWIWGCFPPLLLFRCTLLLGIFNRYLCN